MTQVTVVGDALIDELVDETGTLRVVGGSALNVATGLSILGVSTTLVAMVGDDADGDLIRAHLDDHGVRLLPTISPLGTGVARSERVAGEPRYTFSEPMLRRTLAFDEPQRAAIAGADVVAVSGFPFDDAEQTRLMGGALDEANGVAAVDPNPRAGMLRDATAFRVALEELGARVAVLKIGDDDTRLLYGEPVGVVIPMLQQRYTHVLATDGPVGAGIHLRERTVSSPALARPGEVIDTMGAGDAVFASVLAAIAEDGLDAVDWEVALRHAMQVAAATIAHPGALLRLP